MPAPLQPSEGGVIGAGLSVEAKPASVAAAAAAGNGGGGGGAGSPDNGGWVDFRRDAEANERLRNRVEKMGGLDQIDPGDKAAMQELTVTPPHLNPNPCPCPSLTLTLR